MSLDLNATLYPHENLPRETYSLEDFTTTAMDLFIEAQVNARDGDEQAFNSFLKLVLGGRIWVDDEQRRVFVNARQDLYPADGDEVTVVRDYDSIIAITEDLPFSKGIAIFPVPSFRDTLTEDVHIKGWIFDENVSWTSVL